MQPKNRKSTIIEHLKAGELEVALKQIAEFQVTLKSSDFDPVLTLLKADLKQHVSKEQIRSASRLNRIITALKSLQQHGPDPACILDPVILPQGYHGKILLVSVSGGIIDSSIILRSGDQWHNEILLETQAEIKDLGLISSDAYPLGGAWARFEKDGSILIWGTSDQFGACDKETAAQLLKVIYPDKKIKVEN
jgi:hypothetical protein